MGTITTAAMIHSDIERAMVESVEYYDERTTFEAQWCLWVEFNDHAVHAIELEALRDALHKDRWVELAAAAGWSSSKLDEWITVGYECADHMMNAEYGDEPRLDAYYDRLDSLCGDAVMAIANVLNRVEVSA